MHPADIKASLIKAGSSQSAVARDVSGRAVSVAAVWNVIEGNSKSAPIALRISQITGLPVGQLWPGKYPALEAAHVAHEASKHARRSRRSATRS